MALFQRFVGVSILLMSLLAGCLPTTTPTDSAEMGPAAAVQPFEAYETPDAAIATYEAFIAANPESATAYLQMGRAWAAQRQYGKAIAAYRQATRFAPDSAAAFYHLGLAHKRQQNLNEAITAFNRALQIDPTYADAQAQITDALYKLRVRQGAIP